MEVDFLSVSHGSLGEPDVSALRAGVDKGSNSSGPRFKTFETTDVKLFYTCGICPVGQGLRAHIKESTGQMTQGQELWELGKCTFTPSTRTVKSDCRYLGRDNSKLEINDVTDICAFPFLGLYELLQQAVKFTEKSISST